MRNEDITQQNSLIASPQDEAVKNIEGAKIFNIGADLFKENNKVLSPEVEQMKLPPVATPVVARTIAQSSEHAAAYTPEANKFNVVERVLGYAGNAIRQKVGPEQELNQLEWKRLRSGGVGADEYTDDDELRRQALKVSKGENYGMVDYGADGWKETLLGDVAAQMADVVALAERNKGIIAGFTAGQAAIGGAFGALPGAGAGAISGAITGYRVASVVDAYQNTAGSTFGELDDLVNEKGELVQIPDSTKQYIAHGVGLISGALSFAGDKAVLKSVPFLKKFMDPKNVKDLVLKPASKPMLDAIVAIGKSAAANGTEEALQEILQIAGVELGSSYKDSEVQFVEGLRRTGEKLTKDPQTQERVAKAGVIGGITGGAFTVAGRGIEAGVQKIQDRRAGKTNITNSPAQVQQVADVLETQTAIRESGKILENSDLKKLSPAETNSLRKNILDEYGITKPFYLTKEAVDQFVGSDPNKRVAVEQMLGNELAGLDNNTPAQVAPHTFAEFVDKYPELSEYMQLNPEGPSPNSAEAFLKRMQEADKQRQQIREKLNLVEKTPEERAYAVKLPTADVDSKTLVDALGTQEVAQAYLARLDVNQVEIEAQEDSDQKTAALKDLQYMRERVIALKDQLPNDVSLKELLQQAEPQDPVNDVFGEEDYLNQPTLPPELAQNIPGAQDTIDRFQELRQENANALNEAAEYEMGQVIDIVAAQNLEIEEQVQLTKAKNDPNIDIVEAFINGSFNYPTDRYKSVDQALAAHQKPGFSPYAIDPRTLSEDMKKQFLDDPRLKKYKVFVKGGMNADDAAAIMGVNGGRNLLKILSRTPTRQEAVDVEVQRRKAGIEAQARESVDLDKTSLIKSFHKLAEAHLADMRLLVANDWSGAKKAIKQMTLPIPRIEEIKNNARKVIGATKIGDLNPNRFKVGERKSQTAATRAILDGDIEKAGLNKRAAALNIEMAAEAHKAVGEVNRVVRLAKKLQKASVIQELKDAGKLYIDSVNEILDVFNLDPKKKGESERGSYQKWVQAQIEAGNGNFEVPERFNDVKQSMNDMTVEEVVVMGQRLRTILKQAQMKNRLWNEFGDPAKDLQTMENLSRQLHDESVKHPDYDIDRAKVSVVPTFATRIKAMLDDGLSALKNAEHILLNADNGKVGGLWNQTILAPLKGIGKFENQGEAGKSKDMIALNKQMVKVIDAFGRKEWDRMQSTRFVIPEWADNKILENGKVSEGNLFMMLLNMGNEGNLQRLATNMGTDLETIRTVLERHLDERHAIAAQRIWDMYSSYAPRVQKLQADMTGKEVEMVEALPLTFKDKVYPGGYYPLLYFNDLSLDALREKIKTEVDVRTGETKIHMKDTFYADDMTRHTHTENRTGSDKPLNLSMSTIGMGFEMITHDLNFRKPISDALKILTHPEVSKDLTATVGQADAKVVLNTVIDASRSVQMENAALFDSSKLFERVMARFRGGVSSGLLVFNKSSLMVQPVSLGYAIERMGSVSGVKNILSVVAKMAGNPDKIADFYLFAADINPSIKDFMSGIDDNTRDSISKLMGKDLGHPRVADIDKIRESINNLGFNALGYVDQVQKVAVTLAAYNQFMNGEAQGFSFEDVQKMTPEERDHQAKVYATSISRLTLTSGSQIDRAPIQKMKNFRTLTMFWNDVRNALNNLMRQGREVRQSAKQGNYRQLAWGATGMMMTMVVTRLLEDMLRGQPTPYSEIEKPEELATTEFAEKMMWYMAGSSVSKTFGSVPGVRDVVYSIDYWKKQEDTLRGHHPVEGVSTKIATDFKNTSEYLLDAMGILENEYYYQDKRHLKSVGFVASYLTGGLPVNGIFKIWDMIDEINEDGPIKKHEPIEKEVRTAFNSFKKNTEDDIDPEVLKAIEEQVNGIAPEREPQSVPPETTEIIKQIESQGKWWAKNPNSSAAGLYQFTEGTWNRIMEEAPDLGLTEAGRVSKDTSQQEAAMEYFTKQNMAILSVSDIEPTTENLYAAHFLGPEKAVEVLSSPGDVKLKTLVGGEVMTANGFRNSMKVKDFKSWLKSKVSTANSDLGVDNET